ncbi:hypothetical protein C0Q70_09944 [Pomacea canaliculata]|uniref:Uncharacterized protein n=1 Tax=Pomacea canaliculata TaxID=400727 RepID=A0A2T7PB83_POMCA|nr:hypothetical protein C0Q70_09944 [Pomacea canaliculata]
MLSSASPTVNHNNNLVNPANNMNPACLYGTASPPNFLQSYSPSLSYNMGAALSALHPTSLKDYDPNTMINDPSGVSPGLSPPCLDDDSLEKGKKLMRSSKTLQRGVMTTAEAVHVTDRLLGARFLTCAVYSMEDTLVLKSVTVP